MNPSSVCHCGGSGFSIATIIIIGLLTFLCMLLAGYVTWTQLATDVPATIKAYRDELKRTLDQIQPFLHFWNASMRDNGDADVRETAKAMQSTFQQLKNGTAPLLDELANVKIPSASDSNSFALKIRQQWVWLPKRKYFQEKLDHVERETIGLMFLMLDLSVKKLLIQTELMRAQEKRARAQEAKERQAQEAEEREAEDSD